MATVKEAKDGSLRLLTPGEIALARRVFGDTIQYHKVWIHKGSYLPFGWQRRDTAMTPSGELYFRDDYQADFSNAVIELRHLFIHEMTHVWQYQYGMNVKTRGLISWAVNYHYRLEGRGLRCYRMEQQAAIIADYYLLKLLNDREAWERLNKCTNCDELSDSKLLYKYKTTLRAFPRWQ